MINKDTIGLGEFVVDVMGHRVEVSFIDFGASEHFQPVGEFIKAGQIASALGYPNNHTRGTQPLPNGALHTLSFTRT